MPFSQGGPKRERKRNRMGKINPEFFKIDRNLWHELHCSLENSVALPLPMHFLRSTDKKYGSIHLINANVYSVLHGSRIKAFEANRKQTEFATFRRTLPTSTTQRWQ